MARARSCERARPLCRPDSSPWDEPAPRGARIKGLTAVQPGPKLKGPGSRLRCPRRPR
ncbi:hypothetical protein Salmuc_00809 [Salipiger mucosus DSM 16094]|uniref:Uncharacterized protein n=1 Tax=Salipiger mucosus DSM 16094 TaxID=1123237 RepID=S9R216_9RHOB|nr:hypothetical protein Salmuc_00809 [Salipiger mucosus DSM 16094]